MNEQMDMFQYMQQQKIDYIKHFAEYLKKYVKKHNYDWLDKFQEDVSVENFLKCVCKLQKIFFLKIYEEYYGAKIDKKERTVSFYKCGKYHEKMLAVEPLDQLIIMLDTKNK